MWTDADLQTMLRTTRDAKAIMAEHGITETTVTRYFRRFALLLTPGEIEQILSYQMTSREISRVMNIAPSVVRMVRQRAGLFDRTFYVRRDTLEERDSPVRK